MIKYIYKGAGVKAGYNNYYLFTEGYKLCIDVTMSESLAKTVQESLELKPISYMEILSNSNEEEKTGTFAPNMKQVHHAL